MSDLFHFPEATLNHPDVDEWLSGNPPELFSIAREWFAQFRLCGDDVRELIHDGCPVACVEDAAFGYVNVFRSHVNIGFYTGAFLPDAHQLLEGSRKRMRHIKVRPGQPCDVAAITDLINSAYRNVKARL
jgi:hypothetical protein